ncbi:MAG: hypothetical protein AAF203_03745, partial [Pseudomonadota bacterium]
MIIPLPKTSTERSVDDHSPSLYFFNDLKSTQANHRKELRQQLQTIIQRREPSINFDGLSDLSKRPVLPGYSMSLSHCPLGSGFCLFPDDQVQVGFDLEQKSRLNPKLIERVSTQIERNQSINPLFLFTAKEAAWKAVNKPLSLLTISDVHTTSWRLIEPNWYTYQIERDGQLVDGLGFVHDFLGLHLSF